MISNRMLVVYELLEESPAEAKNNMAAIRSVWGVQTDVFNFAIEMFFEQSQHLAKRQDIYDVLCSKADEYDYFLITRIWRKEIPEDWFRELTNHFFVTKTDYASMNDLEFGGSDHLRLELLSAKAVRSLANVEPKFLPDGRVNAVGHVSATPMMPSVQLVNDYFAEHMGSLYQYPMIINIESSTTCNLACTMCSFHGENSVAWDKKPVIMPLDLYTKILEEAATFDPKPMLEFCHRGEELLDPEFVNKVRMAKEMGFGMILVTNGLLLDNKKTDDLLSIGIDIILISCESIDPEKYVEIMQGKADFGLLERNIDYLLSKRKDADHKTVTGIKNVFLRENIMESDAFKKYWFDFGVDFVSFQNEYYNDNGMFRARNQPYPINFRRACRNLFLSLVINVDGSVQSCSVPDPDDMSVRFGTFPEKSLLDIWRGEPLKSYRESAVEGKHEDIPHCGKCTGEMCTSVLLEKSLEGDLLKSVSPSVVYFEKIDATEGG